MICNPSVAVVSPEDEKALVVAVGVRAGGLGGWVARERRHDVSLAEDLREHDGRSNHGRRKCVPAVRKW